jgi:hypothetical protein
MKLDSFQSRQILCVDVELQMSLKQVDKGLPIEQYRKSLARREIHVQKQVTHFIFFFD